MSILTEILLFCDGGAECPDATPFNQDGARDARFVSASGIRANAFPQGWVKTARRGTARRGNDAISITQALARAWGST